MEPIDLGPLEPLIEAIPDDLQPWVVTAVPILLAVSVLLQAVKPIWQALADIGRWIYRVLKCIWDGIRPPPPPPPVESDLAPEPIPPEETIWETKPISTVVSPLGVPAGIPIITIANMKGGVGKTTLTANLAAAFQSKLSKPVLVIDFDYQGSLTEMLWRGENRGDPELRAHSLINGKLDPEQAQAHARALGGGMEKVELYPSRYPFATIENNIMVDWVNEKTPDDIRFRLARLLRSTAYQSRYGMVLIDCPPRITTGTINALCASTHLLIPTKMDEMSAEAVVYFLQQIERMQKSGLLSSLKVLGVVPTMMREAAREADYESRARERLEFFGRERLRREDLLMMDARVPEKTDIARTAGVGVAYLRKPALRPIFDRLADAVWERSH